jgi:hypothetical protein
MNEHQPGPGTITLLTVIGRDSVVYTVYTGDPCQGGYAREVWRREVPFGRAERFHAGGSAFVAAAREQQTVADSLARGEAGASLHRYGWTHD